MRYYNKVELRLVPGDAANSCADVFDFCSKQSETSRLRRIAALEYENELLRRTASAIQRHLARHGKSAGGAWLDAIAPIPSLED